MARAKRTDRTEARRRYRAEMAAVSAAEAGTDSLVPASSKAAATTSLAPAPRPSIGAAFRGAYRPVDLRGDLRAVPQVLTNWGFLLTVGLTAAIGVWFVLAYNEGMAAIPVGTATAVQIRAVVDTNTIPGFVGQMLFLTPPPAIGAFMIGFTAKRASWLGGFVYGVFVVVVVALVLQTPAGRILTADTPGGAESLIAGHAAFSPIGAALFAALLAWYRRFLDLANPNRSQRPQARPPQGRGDMKPVRR